jgi:hypothetical protein
MHMHKCSPVGKSQLEVDHLCLLFYVQSPLYLKRVVRIRVSLGMDNPISSHSTEEQQSLKNVS